jgi:hypothetical protein
MPGILGGLAGVVMTAIASVETAAEQQFPRTIKNQWKSQLAGLVVTVVIAIVSGALTGMLTNAIVKRPSAAYYTDEAHWTVPTAALTFTTEDVRPDAPRKQSMRMRRSAAGNWAKVNKAVRAVSLLRGMSLGRTNSGNGGAATTSSDDRGPMSLNDD